ncbi:MAG: hypothetical protein ABGZ17_03045, partial [Planctomycetaceae bacterium]
MGQDEQMYPVREPQPTGHALRRCARALLVVCVGVRLGLALSDAAMSPWPELTLSILRDIPQLLAWCGEIVTLVLLDAAQSLLLGALLVLSLGQTTADRRRPAILLSFVCGCGLSCALKSIAV